MEARQHTDRHYDAELKELNLKILEMGGLVEKQIEHAITGLVQRNDDVCRTTIERDRTVNRMDVEIDDLCIRLLALHQPAAKDLRLITTGLKITTDLERIGDIAANICERALELNKEPQLKPFIDIPRMAEIAQTMLRQSLDAFVNENVDLALSVCRDDDTIDQLTGQLFRELISYMVEAPQTITRAIRLLFIAKYLERIADHATNIAEMIVFTVKGKSIRHLDEVPGSV
ncbi:MAG: phosphate signaling complex protein PhoU [Deltaproteobacteria bacterium]|nr:phosphate signaling complex protein PhoU [Deltaproteobacteria bacterium]